jgi:hypothetical protein
VKDGKNVAEDEEGCFEEYRRKNFVDESANFICQSQIHNIMSKAITIYNETEYNRSTGRRAPILSSLVTVIPNGTTVQVLSTRCNGIPECWNNEDEYKCNPNSTETIFTGKSILLFLFVLQVKDI